MEASARELVVSVVREHADSLLRVARRYTACAADAEDAYQRALEIFVKNAHRLDADGAHKWLHVVVRNEALAVRRARSSLVGVEDEGALDALDDGRHLASVEERSERVDELGRAAEALQRLKPQEVTALWLKAEGLSYDEIAERQGWTYTKVNRCITEGRRAFLRRYAGIEAGEECERWDAVLSAIADGEATPQQLMDARPHLRNCPACRATLAAMRDSGRAVASLLPVGLVPALAAGGAPGAAGGLGARLSDAVAALQERAASLALKTQAAAEAVASGKLAAAAASAAALAGGGVAAERHFGEDDARAAAGARPPAAASAAGSAPAAASAGSRPEEVAVAAAVAGARSSAEPSRRPRSSDAPPAEAAFAPEAEPARTAPRPPPGPAPSAPPPPRPRPRRDEPADVEPGGEFGLLAPSRPTSGASAADPPARGRP